MTSFQHLHQPTARTIVHEGNEFLFFGGTAYLGLLANREYIALYKEGIDRYGLNNGTSRTNNVQLGIYEDTEIYLAERFGYEQAALFSSGYLAAQATVKVLSKGRIVKYAPDCHPALWNAVNPNSDGSFQEWANAVVAEINDSSDDEFVLISNSLDNLTPRAYDFSPFDQINSDKKVILILDDSHGLGVLARNRASVDADAIRRNPNLSLVLVASLAKGLGTDAGIVMASKEIITQIKSHPIFTGASPSSPAAFYALRHGQSIYEQAFSDLHRNIESFRKLLGGQSTLNSTANFPVFSSKDSHLYRFLIKNNILISSFPYPLQTSPLLNRIVISALHKEEDLSLLAELCNSKTQ